MSEKRIVGLILGLFIVLGTTYALVTPFFEASDEISHYPMIAHLADGNPLPVQVWDPAEAGPWDQEASQPPLYYYLGAALTFWIDTGDMAQVRVRNPHVDSGLITADGNINLVVPNPEASPWQGSLLAVRLVRLASVLMGAVTVYLTYRIAREVVPDRPEIYLGAAAVNAFLPMFLFISGSVNNDNLAVMLATLALFLIISWTRRRIWRPRRWLLLGVVIGLAVLTKEGTLGLIPLAWGTAVVATWQQRHDRDGAPPLTWRGLPRLLLAALRPFFLLLLPLLIIAGWWYYRNVVLYGDWLGWNAFTAVVGRRGQPASLAQLWDERSGFLRAYWGLFGGVNVPMWSWTYTVLNTLLVAGVLGFLVYLFRLARRTRQAWQDSLPMPATIFRLAQAHFGLLVSLLFSGAVVYGLLNWTAITPASQGRLVFTAIAPLTLLLLLGLVGWLPRRPAGIVVTLFSAFLLLLAAAAPFLWIRPAYTAATYLEEAPATFQAVDIHFGPEEAPRLRLAGYQFVTPRAGQELRPGDELDVYLEWEVLAPMAADWSVFVHLSSPVLNTPVAQRDMYLGQGTLSTRHLQPGTRIVNRYRLRVPPTALAPAELELVVGLYRFDSGERMPGTHGDAVSLARLALAPVPGAVPNATSIKLEDQLELVGYELAAQQVRPEEAVTLTLYWQPLRALADDYTFFAQILNNDDNTRWAGADVPAPTSSWPVGVVQAVTMTLPVSAEAPPNVYPLVAGAYTRTADGGFQNLHLVEDGRIITQTLIELTKIRVLPRE